MILENIINKTLKYNSGIYIILNIVNNKIYIGSTKNLVSRYNSHKNSLIKNKHHSILLQRAFNKYGEDKFIMKLILPCKEQYLFYYEQLLINELNPDYNICPTVRGCRNLKWSEFSKQNLSKIRTGVPNLNKLGKSLSITSKLKISNSHIGKHVGEKNNFYNKTHTIENKEKIRISKIGRLASIDTKKKMSKAKSISIIIENVKYNSIQEAAHILNINKTTLWRKIKKERYETCTS